MDIIDTLISFISDNIGFVITMIIIVLGINGSAKKKKRQAEQSEDAERPKSKSFRDILSEIEAELNEEENKKEPHIPYKPQSEAEGRDLRSRVQGKVKETVRETMEKQLPKKDSPWNTQTTPSQYEEAAAPWKTSPMEEGRSMEGYAGGSMEGRSAGSTQGYSGIPMEGRTASIEGYAGKSMEGRSVSVEGYAGKSMEGEAVSTEGSKIPSVLRKPLPGEVPQPLRDAVKREAAAIADAVHLVPMDGAAIAAENAPNPLAYASLEAMENWNRAMLVNGVVMSEVLGKPKALRRGSSVR